MTRLGAVIPARYRVYGACVAGFVGSLALLPHSVVWGWPAAVLGALSALGTWDLLQRRRAVRRNYPILAHLRYCLESIGPEIRQYFIQSDTEERPFSREQRSVVYQRAKGQLDKKPFGTLLDVYGDGYEWINHTVQPTAPGSADFRVEIGGTQRQPYRASVFNISAMSFGSLSGNAIAALGRGAARGGFYLDTGEGAISPHHADAGADLVWEIGSGYFGCRTPAGDFDEAAFRQQASRDAVKMVEVKLSQGAKPGHGGILPGTKVTAEIANTRGVPVGETIVSPPAHSAFATPVELIGFLDRLRSLSGGKPVGIKLAIGHPWEWFAIAKAMLETGSHPDFVVVDGAEGGTGAAPLEFINRLGMPLEEALLLVHNTLVGCDLRDRVRVAAAGRITSAFKIARVIGMGADWCNAARGFMFALGCIQSLSCHTDRCPTGIATQDPLRARGLDVGDKSARVYNFHSNTLEALRGLISASGLNHPSDLRPGHIMRRVSGNRFLSYAQLFDYLEPGELLRGVTDRPVFREYWTQARPDSFRETEFGGPCSGAGAATTTG